MLYYTALHSTLILPNKNLASATTTHDSSGDNGNDRKNALDNHCIYSHPTLETVASIFKTFFQI
jgi:hypothetical protein